MKVHMQKLTGCTALALCVATPALAQPTPQAQDDAAVRSSLDDIVVTARRVTENLQSVPVAVTAFSGENLQQQNATRVPDIARLTPGFAVREASGTPAATVLSIRGQVQNDTLATLDPSVGIYVDDLYWARAIGINSDLLDIANVQILKGPQGTLFGRNTTGGALLIQTANPNLDAASGRISVGYGSFDSWNASAIVNLPLIADRVAVRAAIQHNESDGYVHDPLYDRTYGGRDSWIARGKLLAQLTENLSVQLSGEYYKMDELSSPFRAAAIDPTSVAALEIGFQQFGLGDPATRAGQGYAIYQGLIASQQNSDTVSVNLPPRTFAKARTYQGVINLDTFFGAVKFVGGYRRTQSNTQLDLDGTQYRVLDTEIFTDIEQYSGELQVTGSTQDEKLDFAGGLLYFKETGTDGSSSVALPSLNPFNPTLYDASIENRSQGLYAQMTYHLTDRLGVTGGLRYSVEDKNMVSRNRGGLPGGGFACNVPVAPGAPCLGVFSNDFDGLSYTFGLDYKVADDVLIYAKTAKGFRSGGQNERGVGSLDAFAPFSPEIAYSYEAGLKSELFDRRLRFNLAGYYTRIDDIQRSVVVVSPQGVAATVVLNAGKARVIGLEAELTAQLFEGFRLGLTGNLTRPKYLRFVDPTTGADRSDEPFDTVPKYSFSVAADYDRPIGSARLVLHSDFAFQGETPLQPYVLTGQAKQSAIDPAGGVLNARATLQLADGRFELSVFGTNLFDRRDPVTAQYLTAPLSLGLNKLRAPRMVGIQGTFNFGD